MKKLLFIMGVVLFSCSKKQEGNNVLQQATDLATWPVEKFNLKEGHLEDSTQVKLLFIAKAPLDPKAQDIEDELAKHLKEDGQALAAAINGAARFRNYYDHYVALSMSTNDTVNILCPANIDINKENLGELFYYLGPDNKLTKISRVDLQSGEEDKTNTIDDLNARLITKVVKSKEQDNAIYFDYPTVIGLISK